MRVLSDIELQELFKGLGMAQGDILMFDGTSIAKLVPGAAGTVLASAGPGNPLTFANADGVAGAGVQYSPTLTGLTGGTSTDLDSLLSEDLTIGHMQAILETETSNYPVLRYYELISGAIPAERAPWVIAPDDYVLALNERYWVERFPHHRTHAFATSTLLGDTNNTKLDWIPTLNLPAGFLLEFQTPDGCTLVYELVKKARNAGDNLDSVDSVGNTLTLNDNNLIDGHRVMLSSTGDLPTGLDNTTLYHVINNDGQEFQVSLLSGGAAVTFSDTGTGTHSVIFYDVPFEVEPADYAAGTNESYWVLRAPWTTTTFEVIPPLTDHTATGHTMYRAPMWWKVKDATQDVQSLASGTGAGPLGWHLEIPVTSLSIFVQVSQTTLSLRAISDTGATINQGNLPLHSEIDLVIDDLGMGTTAGKGSVIHVAHFYCPIGE